MSSLLRRCGRAVARPEVRRARRTTSLEVVALEGRALLSTLSAVQPSADEQYMLQLVNRARANPAAEAQRLLTLSRVDSTIRAALTGWDASAFLQEMNAHGSAPPLAFNTRLIAAARAQDSAMLAANAQIHSVAGSLVQPTSPDQLAPDGLPYFPSNNSAWSTAENIFAYSGNLANPHGKPLVDYFHAAFLLDWGNPDFGHLRNLLLPGPSGAAAAGTYPMSEVGIGIITDVSPTVAPTANPLIGANRGLNVGPALVTQEFAWRSGHEFLTGVFYTDRDGDNFYTPGEALAGVTITAVGRSGQGTFTTTTWGSGGYSLDLPQGQYDVTASGGGLLTPRSVAVAIGQDNVGWDVSIPASTPTPVVTAPIVIPPTTTGTTAGTTTTTTTTRSDRATYVAPPTNPAKKAKASTAKHKKVVIRKPHPKPHPRLVRWAQTH